MKGIIIVDKSDFEIYEKKKLPWPVHMVFDCTCFRDKVNMGAAAFPNEPFYGVLGDDMVPETPGWDTELARVAGNRNIAGSSQVYIKGRIGAGAVGGDLVRVLGWLCCPAVRHFYSDDVMELIGSEFGCLTVRDDIRIAHHHFAAGKAPYDASYKTRGSAAEDKIAFENWKRTEWPAVRQRISSLYEN